MSRGDEDDVVAFARLGEIVARVVDDVLGADRPDKVHLARAANAGDVASEGLGDLHDERPTAPRRTDDEHRLSLLNLADLSDGLERGRAGDGNSRRLLEGEVRRLRGDLVRPCGRIFGERAVAG